MGGWFISKHVDGVSYVCKTTQFTVNYYFWNKFGLGCSLHKEIGFQSQSCIKLYLGKSLLCKAIAQN